MEKFEIANYPGTNLLNKRTEVVAKCRHRNKHLLLNHVEHVELDAEHVT